MKRALIVAAAAVMSALILSGCAKAAVHCDRCGKEIKVTVKSGVTEDWIIYCEDCAEEIGPMVEPRD